MKNKWNAIKEKICLFFWIAKEKWFINCLHCITIFIYIILWMTYKPIVMNFILNCFDVLNMQGNYVVLLTLIIGLFISFFGLYLLLLFLNICYMSLDKENDLIIMSFASVINIILSVLYLVNF